MKTPAFLTLVLAACLAAGPGAVPAAPQMSESDAEFFTSGDFDGDGRTDSLIIDKAAGVLLIGYQTAAETWTWAPARAAGTVPVTAAAAGRFLGPMRDEIAVTSRAANRVLVHPADDVLTAGAPVVHFHLIGPDALAPLRLPGYGAREQMLCGSAVDPAASPYVLAAFDPNGGLLHLLPQDAVLHQGQPVILKTGRATNAAFLADGPGGSELRVYDGVLAAPPVLMAGGVAAGAHYAPAHFNPASDLAQVLFWTPGEPTLRVRPVTEPVGGSFAMGPETTHPLSGNITQLTVLNDPAGPRLLVLFDEGTSAGIFTFDGSNPPVLVTLLTPSADERFRAVTLSGGGGFVLSSSPSTTQRSQTFRPYRRASSSTYTALTSASLPVVTTNAGRANVLLFSGPPFVDDFARPLAALQAGDWTRSISLAGGNVSAVAETFGGTAAGLDNPVSLNLGPPVAGADEVLANQFEPYLSISSLRPVYDTPEIEPAILPGPGAFDTAQQLRFSAPAGVTISFRIGSGPWQTWTGNPVWLLEDVTVSYYGMDGFLRKSALRTAAYTFSHDGPFADSDHDGVPDFVETTYGLDPRTGPDSDGDTWTDDTEMLAGTDPNNAADPVLVPPPGINPPLPPRAANTGVNLTATLRSWRAGVPDPTLYPQPGTRIDALDTAGTLLATRTTPGAIPAIDRVVMENLAVPRGTRFISLTTAPSWNREEGLGTVIHGSQSIAMVPAPPAPPPLVIAYLPGGGTPAAEAAAWVAALAAAEAAQTPREIYATLSPVDSLVALLVEKTIDDLLIARGANPATRLSMFDTGLTDAGARRVTPAQLAALELPGPANEPAWRIDQLHPQINLAVQDDPGSAEVQALRALAADLFEQFDRVWQPPTETDPDGNTAAFPAPIDLLRSMVRGEAWPQGYLDVSALTAEERSGALAAIAAILALPAPRTEATLTLTARADSWGADCTVLDHGATRVALVDHEGKSWRFRGSVTLPAGALMEVRGFTDRPPPPPACASSTVEVISATVQTLPGGPVTDLDGDSLGDEWELVFFGNLGQISGGDFDGDGASNAEELAAGTDPAGRPGAALVSLALPVPDLGITLDALGRVELTWECSEECRRTLVYSLECDPGLMGDWQVLSASPAFLPDGRMSFTIEPIVPGRCFFRIRVTQP